MKNEKEPYRRDNLRSLKPKAKTPVSAGGGVCAKSSPKKRSAPNPEEQTAVRTACPFADGFLKTAFLPKMGRLGEETDLAENPIKIEREFYRSLSQLAEYYGLKPMKTRSYGYPYNLALAFWDVKNQLHPTGQNETCFQVIQDDGGKTCLVSKERYPMGDRFYHIPIIPLFLLRKDKRRKRVYPLLLSVCSCLFHQAEIPCYRQGHTYLNWIYEIMYEWETQDDYDEDGRDTALWELRQAELVGDFMLKKIQNLQNLTFFEKRLKSFFPKNGFEEKCRNLAEEFFFLFREFPNAAAFQNAHCQNEDGDALEEGSIIFMDKYVSFVADTKGLLYENLAEVVNQDFQECYDTEEPTLIRKFDGSPMAEIHLNFEEKLFPLLITLEEFFRLSS